MQKEIQISLDCVLFLFELWKLWFYKIITTYNELSVMNIVSCKSGKHIIIYFGGDCFAISITVAEMKGEYYNIIFFFFVGSVYTVL